MKTLGFVFRSHPHSTTQGREGLDALLATSAYSEDVHVFFIGEGVTQLLANQDTTQIHSRNYSPAYKLMELYDIDNVFACEASLIEQGINDLPLILEVEKLPAQELAEKLNHCDKVLTF